jgi:hypothetical protein
MREDIVAFINDMIDTLTWQRVGLFLVFMVVMISMLVLYENRTAFIDSLLSRPSIDKMEAPWELSEASKAELKKLTQQSIVGGVLMTEVDLKKNRRVTKFWYVRDSTLRDDIARTVATLLPQPFFNDDAKNNFQMLEVFGNVFVCSRTVDTVFHAIFPNMHKELPVVCRLSVPPFTGDFAGFITIALTREPTPSEEEALKIEISRISINMYIRDIQQKNRK